LFYIKFDLSSGFGEKPSNGQYFQIRQYICCSNSCDQSSLQFWGMVQFWHWQQKIGFCRQRKSTFSFPPVWIMISWQYISSMHCEIQEKWWNTRISWKGFILFSWPFYFLLSWMDFHFHSLHVPSPLLLINCYCHVEITWIMPRIYHRLLEMYRKPVIFCLLFTLCFLINKNCASGDSW
jgi:hypothetical protein